MNSTSKLDLSGHQALRPLSTIGIGIGIGQASFLWREKKPGEPGKETAHEGLGQTANLTSRWCQVWEQNPGCGGRGGLQACDYEHSK